MGLLWYLDETGDQKVMWDKSNDDEVEVAEMTFDKLKKKGYKAFKVDKEGNPAGEMKKFDPKAGKIIMSPMVEGG